MEYIPLQQIETLKKHLKSFHKKIASKYIRNRPIESIIKSIDSLLRHNQEKSHNHISALEVLNALGIALSPTEESEGQDFYTKDILFPIEEYYQTVEEYDSECNNTEKLHILYRFYTSVIYPRGMYIKIAQPLFTAKPIGTTGYRE